jgi:hypothetical protein
MTTGEHLQAHRTAATLTFLEANLLPEVDAAQIIAPRLEWGKGAKLRWRFAPALARLADRRIHEIIAGMDPRVGTEEEMGVGLQHAPGKTRRQVHREVPLAEFRNTIWKGATPRACRPAPARATGKRRRIAETIRRSLLNVLLGRSVRHRPLILAAPPLLEPCHRALIRTATRISADLVR